MIQQRPGPLDYGLMVALAAIWGGSFMGIKIAVAEIPPLTIGAGRVMLATLVFLTIVRLSGRSLPRRPASWALMLAVGLVGTTLPFFLIAWGQIVVDAGPAAILMAGVPLYTLVLAHFFVAGDRLSPGKVIGLVFGLAGLVVLVGPENLARLGDDTIRQLAIAGAALCYAVTA
ncbi:MAG: DMT family transporter [Pseudomonadota bacterium]